MEDDIQGIPESRMEYTNTSRCLFVGPLVFKSCNLAGDGANADCQIYDGLNANGELKGHLESLSGTTFHLDVNGGVLFRTGLYISVNAATSKVTVVYEPASPKKV